MTIKLIVLALMTTLSITIQATSIIEKISIAPQKIIVYTPQKFHQKYLLRNFFAKYPDNIDLTKIPISIATIPFIMHVIPIIWASGEAYTINEMDYDLFYALQEIKKTFQLFYETTSWDGQLIPKKLVRNTPVLQRPDDEIAILFSHGLDAIYTSLSHSDKQQLLIMVCGTDVRINQKNLWRNAYNQCKQFAQDHSQQPTFVISNPIDFAAQETLNTLSPDIEKWWSSTSQGLGYTSLAAPILYQHGYKHLLIAASFSRNEPSPCGTHPLIENNIKFAGSRVIHDGTLTRTEKIGFIKEWCSNNNKPYPMLHVCWNNSIRKNCNQCEKCMYTIFAVLLNNELPSSFGFDNATLDLFTPQNFNILQDCALLSLQRSWREEIGEGKKWLITNHDKHETAFHQVLKMLIKIPLSKTTVSPEKFRILQDLWDESIAKNSL